VAYLSQNKNCGARETVLACWRFTANQFISAPSPLRPTTSNFIFQLNTFGYSSYVTSSLTRGRVCRVQLSLALASTVILGSESRGAHDHILLSQIRDSPNLEGHIPAFISPRNRWPNYTLKQWVPFASPPTARRATVEVFDPASTLGGLAENTVSNIITEQYFQFCLRIGCRGKLFTESLPSHERLQYFHYSGFQTSCHTINHRIKH
jgi:hypothetical protein